MQNIKIARVVSWHVPLPTRKRTKQRNATLNGDNRPVKMAS